MKDSISQNWNKWWQIYHLEKLVIIFKHKIYLKGNSKERTQFFIHKTYLKVKDALIV